VIKKSCLFRQLPKYFKTNYLLNSCLTKVEIILPSAFPASLAVRMPITLPISCGEVAPDASRTQKVRSVLYIIIPQTMKATITKPNTKNSEVSKTESKITLVAEEETSNDKFPRVDISSSLNDISANLMDANWKIRKEGLDQIIATLDGANNCIKSNLGGILNV
jgi:hypothetical protein